MALSLTPLQLTTLANQYGTPLYIYNADRINAQYKKLNAAFSGQNVKIFYAAKALTNINILRYIHSLGAGIDCSSINEVRLALYAGIASENMLYTSNSISIDEIMEAKELGVHVNIDSLSNLEKFGAHCGHSYPVGIRLRPNIMAGGNLKIATGHDKSKFGIPVDQLDQVLQVVKKYHLHIRGLHLHTGSEVSDVPLLLKAISLIFDLAPHFPELAFFDLGGGFKVPYSHGDTQTDIHLLAKSIGGLVETTFPTDSGSAPEIWLEPGKFLVSAAGYFVSKVNVLKPTANTCFAGMDSGFNHLIRPMFYDAWHHIENISNPDGEIKKYSVVGNICETDTFAWDRSIAEIREGDLLSFSNAGAYGFEMASNFNSRYRPAEIMVENGQSRLIRKREGFEDLIRNQALK